MINFELSYIKGDLIKMAQQGDFDVVIHGCNCFNTMGAGIAKSIKKVFPEAFEADDQTTKGDIKKLGTISIAKINDKLTVVNAYTQYTYSRSGKPFDYDAFAKCLDEVKLKFTGKKIGMPKIGAGLAGGDWDKIESIIVEKLKNEDVTVVVFE